MFRLPVVLLKRAVTTDACVSVAGSVCERFEAHGRVAVAACVEKERGNAGGSVVISRGVVSERISTRRRVMAARGVGERGH